MNGNTLATVAGGIIAAAAAAEPVLIASGGGALHSQDYVQLIIAVATALFGWFTKFKGKKTP